MFSKTTYAVQPYQVGQKNKKSLALVIPARLARKYDIDPSTIFAIRGDNDSNRLILEMIEPYKKETTVPAKSSPTSNQQTPDMRVQR